MHFMVIELKSDLNIKISKDNHSLQAIALVNKS